VLDVAEGAEHGELVGVDVAVEVDVGDTDAAGISAAAVPADHVQHLSGAGMIFAEHAEVEVRAVAMVVDGEDFDAFAAGDQVGGAVEDGIDSRA